MKRRHAARSLITSDAAAGRDEIIIKGIRLPLQSTHSTPTHVYTNWPRPPTLIRYTGAVPGVFQGRRGAEPRDYGGQKFPRQIRIIIIVRLIGVICFSDYNFVILAANTTSEMT